MKWSAYAGVYAFLCGVVLLVLLRPVADTLVRLLALPAGYSVFLLAGPVTVIGAGVWWAVVERRGEYTYRLGGIVGMLTALFTVLLWVLLFAIVWGPVSVLAGGVLVFFVLVVSAPVAFIAGLPLMYARHRLGTGPSDGAERAR